MTDFSSGDGTSTSEEKDGILKKLQQQKKNLERLVFITLYQLEEIMTLEF